MRIKKLVFENWNWDKPNEIKHLKTFCKVDCFFVSKVVYLPGIIARIKSLRMLIPSQTLIGQR